MKWIKRIGVLACAAAAMTLAGSSAGSESPRCTTAHLHITLGPYGAGLGHIGVPIRFRNEDGTCNLRGYPNVEGLSADGRTVVRARHTLRGYLGGARQVSTITLAPGQTASALLEGENFPSPGHPCPSYRYLRITPPHAARSVRRDARYRFCYPVVAGSSGRQS